MLNALIITNILFNSFFGIVCAFISYNFVKNQKKINKATAKPKNDK